MVISYLEDGTLPITESCACKVIVQAPLMTLEKVYCIMLTPNKCVVVPQHLWDKIMSEYDGGVMAGHFSGLDFTKHLPSNGTGRGCTLIV